MMMKWKATDKRVVNNLVDLKVISKKNYYMTGVDEKGKSYIGTVEDVSYVEARRSAEKWAKKNRLTLGLVKTK